MNCLVYPSIVFSDFVQSIEDLFCALFGGVMYQKDLLHTLCSNAGNEISQIHKCGNVHCFARLQEYVKLYMMVRIHHAIKFPTLQCPLVTKEIQRCSNYATIKSSLFLYINVCK